MTDPISATDIFLHSTSLSSSPEEYLRCRICYDVARPLVSVCDCSGTMAYVHEDCILDWIMKKISDAVTVSLPSCEVCHQQYRAHVK